MDFQSAMETFAEAWVAANTKVPLNDVQAQSQALALTKDCKTPPLPLSRSSPYSTSNLDRDRTRSPPPVSATTTQSHSGDIEGIVSSPMGARSIKEEFDLTKSTPGKSLPVHCVVETVNSLEETPPNSPWRRRPVIETDSYVIIPINTVFHELVQVALQRLGYSSDSASAAKGSVVIKNWKPLSFDKIADGPLLTVGDILGELTTVATLRIQVYRARPSAIADIKDKLLRLFLAQAHGLLLSTGCPLDEIFLSQICRTQGSIHGGSELSEEVCRKFDQWFLSQVTAGGNHSSGRSQTGMQVSPNAISMAGGTVSGAAGLTGPPKVLERSPSIGPLTDHVHPALQTVQSQYPTQKTRMRTSFDPELELPKLQSWFAENQHPSRQQIQLYVKELNGLESRRGRKPLDVNNVVYWFKNARAAQKRAETRGGVMSQGSVPCHLGVVNGYNSNVHSPSNNSGGLLLPGENYMSADKLDSRHHLKSPFTSGMIRDHSGNVISNDMSNGGSDLDDDDDDLGDQHCSDEEPPNSPTAPLSLTTTSRNQDQSNEHQQSSERSSPLDVIKEEPNSDSHPRSPETNVNNNNHKKSAEEDVLDMDEDETDDGSSAQREESPQQHRSSTTGQPHFGPNDDPLYRIDLNRPAIRSFRTPTPEMDTSGALIPHGGAGPGTAGALDRIAAGFPLVPNSMFSHSIMYMSHYIPGLSHGRHGLSAASPPGGSGLSAMSAALASSAVDERRKRNRTFIDPVTEVPRLEQWFSLSTHPSHNLILKYTEELNRMPYRQKFPRLEPKNVQFWFKNRRAKCKRLKMALYDNPLTAAHTQYHHTDRD